MYTRTVGVLAVVALVCTMGVAAGAGPLADGTSAAAESTEAANVAQHTNNTSVLIVESLQAPDAAAPGSTVVVNATVRNPTNETVTEDVAFRIEGGGVDLVRHETVEVNASSTANVSFELDTTGVPMDEYIHGVTTDSSSEFAVLQLTNQSKVDFGAQETDGTTVTVDAVFVPEGGFVTIHDSTLLEGDALGSVVGVSAYLEPGYYENVEVTLYGDVPGADFEQDRLTEDETLIAMPHLDSNGTETYDFLTANGSEDGPYTVDGEAVVEAGNVTVRNATSP